LARRPAEHPDLVVVNRCLSGGKVTAGARFHFDKAESGVFPGHQVKIATNLRATPAPRYNDVTAAPQIEKGSFFPPAPHLQMSRAARPSPQTDGERIASVNKSLKQPER
jgi:hypothetical protein